MTKTQRNKKKFIKPFRGMITRNGKNGLVYIPKECIVELINEKILVEIQNTKNRWYIVKLRCEAEINLLEVEPDFYKIVSGGKIGRFLQHYQWKYDEKNVYCTSITTGKNVRIERVILNYQRYGYFKYAHTDEAAHHMWFRFCALEGMLKSLPEQAHLAGHSNIGNYDRGQSVKISTVADFQYFISVIEQYRIFLKNKQFSIEF